MVYLFHYMKNINQIFFLKIVIFFFYWKIIKRYKLINAYLTDVVLSYNELPQDIKYHVLIDGFLTLSNSIWIRVQCDDRLFNLFGFALYVP